MTMEVTKQAYNRICDMKTGQCAVREHNDIMKYVKMSV